MTKGKLKDYFKGAAAKKLKAVDIDPKSSNQHEFNGVNSLKKVLGTEKKDNIPTQFIYLDDGESGLTENLNLTWYDSRENHPTRSEWRLYYGSNGIIPLLDINDTAFILLKQNNELLVVFAKNGSMMENKLSWLFDIPIQDEKKFFIVPAENFNEKDVDFVVRYILDELGIQPEEDDSELLDKILAPYKLKFPTTKEFSLLARNSCPEEFSSIDDPDGTIIKWFDFEDKLFRRMERKIISKILESGFQQDDGEIDVDGFIKTSLSVHNRRKSRAGHAFEHHLEQLFVDNNLRYVRTPKIEGTKKPDFLFPSVEAYNNDGFPSQRLRILGAKTTAKDRWRQILSEANRIENKHFVTLETGISNNQTDEMKGENLQLVIPKPLFSTYTEDQQSWLMSLGEFIDEIKDLYPSSFNLFSKQ